MKNYDKAPAHVRGCIERYVESRIPPGHFMTAVLENNLKEAFARADEINRATLFETVQFLYWEVPASCWGSPERVHNWLTKREEEKGP